MSERAQKDYFSTHISKNLVARVGGSTEMFEMAAGRQWNWSPQADLGKRADIPVILWNSWTGMGWGMMDLEEEGATQSKGLRTVLHCEDKGSVIQEFSFPLLFLRGRSSVSRENNTIISLCWEIYGLTLPCVKILILFLTYVWDIDNSFFSI